MPRGKRTAADGALIADAKRVRGDDAGDAGGDDADEQRAPEDEAAPGRNDAPQAPEDDAVPDHNDWLCSGCLQFTSPSEIATGNPGTLLMCDGPCLRSWHMECLDMETAPEGDWLCPDCSSQTHPCAVCGDVSKVDTIGGVIKCSVPHCPYFFHGSCVLSNPLGFTISRHEPEVEENDEPAQATLRFRCNAHSCETCVDCETAPSAKSKRQLLHCKLCPTSWHPQCIPPTTRATSDFKVLYCERHPDVELPRDEEDDAERAQIAAASAQGQCSLEPSDLARLIIRLPKPPGAEPDPAKKRDRGHFRLSTALKTEVESRPPVFQHIATNKYLIKPLRKEMGSLCECTEDCDEACLNRLVRIECIGNGADCAAAARGARRAGNCPFADCANRHFSRRRSSLARLQPFREGAMGWGLKTMDAIEKGSMVCEYVGEVIDQTELDKRLEHHNKHRPGDHNMYVMELDHGTFIDARRSGSISRYINHSCDPNCELQKWTVAGFTRIGIFARTNIAPGAPLSYDYRFSTNEVRGELVRARARATAP